MIGPDKADFRMGGKLPGEQYGLQMLRAVAATAVVLHHALEQSNGAPTPFSPEWLTTFGASGVDTFFVISGFIMLYTSFRFSRPPIRASSFLWRRASRIYPLYWTCCLLMIAMVAAGLMRHSQFTLKEVALSFMLLPSSKPLIGVSWTLVYEAYFYVIFSITLLFRSALISALATTIVIGVAGLAGSLLGSGAVGSFFANPIPCEFAFGLWIAVAFTRLQADGRRWPLVTAWAAPGFILLVLAPLFVSHQDTEGLPGWPRVIAWGLPAGLIVAASLSIPDAANGFSRMMVKLGDSSYALYLTHPFVMDGYALALRLKPVGHMPQIVLVSIMVLLSVAVGVVVHSTIEKPLLKLIRRRTRRETAAAEAAIYG